MEYFTFFILVSAVCLTRAVPFGGEECPPSGEIYPCFCTKDPYLTSVDCDGLSSLSKVKDIVEKTKGKNISFAFWKSRLGDIPSDLFQGQLSTNLHFENCKISSFGDKPFTGLENTLNRLYIYGSIDKRIKDLTTFPLGHLKQLKNLNFMGNDIKRLGNDWFNGGPASLEHLDLQANDIEELGDRAFADLVNIEDIWLGDNSFKRVSRSMFPKPALKLDLLEISFNGIEVLPEDIFTDMPVLRTINVSGNKFKTIPETTWGAIWNQLDEVYVDRTQLECDEKVKWIFKRKLPKILDGKCYGYNKLRGKKLEEMTINDFE